MTRVELDSGSHGLLMCEQNGVWGVEETYKTGEIREWRWVSVERSGLSRAILLQFSSKDILHLHYIYNIWIFPEEAMASSGYISNSSTLSLSVPPPSLPVTYNTMPRPSSSLLVDLKTQVFILNTSQTRVCPL